LKFQEMPALIAICLAIDPLRRDGDADAWLRIDEKQMMVLATT